MRPWILAEQNHAAVRARRWEVAVLPFGATEPHNLHMPYGTDNFQVEAIAGRACERAFRAGAKVLLLPTIPYGVNTNYFKVPGGLACSLTPTTILRVLTDLTDSLERQGVLTTEQGSGTFVAPLPAVALAPEDRQAKLRALCAEFLGQVAQYGFGPDDVLRAVRSLTAERPS